MAARTAEGRLYSPKLIKDIKFVAHNSLLINDFQRNFSAYTTTLQNIINSPSSKDDVRAKAQGYLQAMTRTTFKIQVEYLRAVTSLLKRYSLRFQSSDSLVNDYVNLYESLTYVLGRVVLDNSSAPSPACQFWFSGYVDLVNTTAFIFPQRTSRSTPQLDATSSQQAEQQSITALQELHQKHIESLKFQVNHYWWGHARHWSETAKIVPQVGHWLNFLEEKLSIMFIDPVRPDVGRCSCCSALVKPDRTVRQGIKEWTRHKTRTVNNTQPCLGATLTVIQSLGAGFVRKTIFDYRIISPLSFMPTQVSPASLTSLVDQLQRAKVSLLAKSLNVTLQRAIKHVLTSPTLRHPVEPGVQHLILTAACMAHSEAICETLGSIVEKYHALRHTNTGPSNEDPSIHREMFVRLNGPPMHSSAKFVKKIVAKLVSGQVHDNSGNVTGRKVHFATNAYLSGKWSDHLTSSTINRLIAVKSGRKGVLEHF